MPKKITIQAFVDITRAFYTYTAGVEFRSEEAKEKAFKEYLEEYQPKIERDTDTFLGKPALRPEDVIKGANIPDYVLAYFSADRALKYIGKAYDMADTALTLLGYSREAAAKVRGDIGAANWNAERVRERAYGALIEAGGTLDYKANLENKL